MFIPKRRATLNAEEEFKVIMLMLSRNTICNSGQRIIKNFPSGIFTSTRIYSNSVVEPNS